MKKLSLSVLILAPLLGQNAEAQTFLQSQGGIGGIVGSFLNNIRPQQPPPQYQPAPYQPAPYQPAPYPPPGYSDPQRYPPRQYHQSQTQPPQPQQAPPPRQRAAAQYGNTDAPPNYPKEAADPFTGQTPPLPTSRAKRPDPTEVKDPADPFASPMPALPASRAKRPPSDTTDVTEAADPFAGQMPSAIPPPTAKPAEEPLRQPTAPPPNKVVHVIGHGPTVSEARSDAIRQALQQTMQQLIVVDRAVSNDEVTRNNILSTMNGYVEAFSETRTFVDNRQYAVEADVTVSASRVVNFIGSTSGASAEVSGQSIAANRERIAANRKVKGEMFDRLFRGYPADALDIAVKAISLPENDIDHLYVDFAIRFSPSFISSLRSGLGAIAEHKTRNAYDRAKTMDIGSGHCPVDSCTPETTQSVLFNINEVMNKNTRHGPDLPARFCIYGQTEDCFELPIGQFGASFSFAGAPRLKYLPTLIVLRFLDKSGQPVGSEGADSLCTVAPAINVSFIPPYAPETRNPRQSSSRPPVAYDLLPLTLNLASDGRGFMPPDSYVFDYPRTLRIIIPIASIDMSKVDRVAAFAAESFVDPRDPRNKGVLLDLLQGPVDQGTACEKLDRAGTFTIHK